LESFGQIVLDAGSAVPIYRQLAQSIETAIRSGSIEQGKRLPATRELAGQLGLNRTTVSAAYALLEEAGLLDGQVGRGSFVSMTSASSFGKSLDWDAILPALEPFNSPPAGTGINFASSRPAQSFFPITEFRKLSKEVIDSPEALEILQLGSPYGYAPLRKYLLSQSTASRIAKPGDDLIITNGCQQAFDLLSRIFVTADTSVVLEDPVYHGLLRVFARSGAALVAASIREAGLSQSTLEDLFARHRPRLMVVTPDFQNPTGLTLTLDQRKGIIAAAQRFGVIVVENEIYRDLRYSGQALPPLKQLDQTGNVLSIGSYSKVAFPGLRVGWILAPQPVIARLAEAKQTSDLHSDQLSQAVLLRFAESGALADHLERTRELGSERLRVVLEACEKGFPPETRFTRPEGGMNLWVELPAPLTSEELLKAAEEQGVSFLTGNYFSVRRMERRGLRISFGGLRPADITRGIAILGGIARNQLNTYRARAPLDAAAALV
jgi:DNA-binding transcriptional MocR family regulator